MAYYLHKSDIIHNELEYNSLLNAYDIKDEYRRYGSISNMIKPPTHYPCILVWYEDDSYGSTYWVNLYIQMTLMKNKL